jgi:3D (Asp-Asp-Asp) domain-containing protein
VIHFIGYFILYPGKQPKYLVHRYPFSLDVFKQVTLTTYTTDSNQTDSTPLITASGFKLDSINPRRHRVIAVSRDLKRKLKFGDKVRLSNAGRFNGVWYVRDLMNKRFKNKIDVLINPNGRHTKLSGVVITKID